MKIIVTASGGGHTGYAIAVGEQLLRKGYNVSFIVDPNDRWTILRLTKRLNGNYNLIWLRRLREPNEQLTKIMLRLPTVTIGSLKLEKLIRTADVLVCTGSNHSLLPTILARFKRIQTFCIEAVDRIVTRSRTVALLHDFYAIPVALHWPSQRQYYRRGLVVGPIYEKPMYKPENEDYILVLTGTQGNPRLVSKLLQTSLENIVIQTGRATPPEFIKRYKPNWKAFRYTPDIDRWVARARLVIAHQGLSIVEAALAYHKPVLLACNPDLPLTSGWKDAQLLAKYLNTRAINPAILTPKQLEEEIYIAMRRKPPQYTPGATALSAILEALA